MFEGKFKLRAVASYLVLIKDDTILLLRRLNTGFEDGNYGMVSGHLDEGESVIQSIIREAKEEANLILKREDLEIVHVMHRRERFKSGPRERIDFFIKTKNWEGEPENMERHKCDDLSWFDLNNLPDNTIPYVRHAIKNIQDKTFYSEFGWE